MGEQIQLNTSRTQCIGAYVARPEGAPRGGIVVVQEIFGVNAHMRRVTDRFAEQGYVAIAPAFFDHVETGVELGYDEAGFKRGRELVGEISFDLAIEDVASAAEAIRSAGRIGCVGYCWGGTVAFLAATRFGGLAAAICYYGGQIARNADRKPRCPVQMHFGEDDDHISMDDVETIRQKRPECEIHIYPGAGHAFSNEDRSNYELRSAKIAWHE